MLLTSWYFFFGCHMPQLDRIMPSRSVLGNWVLRYGQVCKEREAKVCLAELRCLTDGSVMQVISEAAAVHGVTLNSDASTKLGQGGKKMQVCQKCDAGIYLTIDVFICVCIF